MQTSCILMPRDW